MKKYIFLPVFFSALLILAACADEPDSNEENAVENETENDGGNLVVDIASDPVSLDPHAANDGNSLYVMNAMYDTLVALDTNLELQPALPRALNR